VRVFCLFCLVAVACNGPRSSDSSGPRVRLWHNFNPQETEALNGALERREGPAVEITRFPFSRGLTILSQALAAGTECADLVRIDASWLPALVEAGLLVAAPDTVDPRPPRDWLPEAAELAEYAGAIYALPQSLDGLALVHRAGSIDGVAWPPASVDALLDAATQLAQSSGDSLGVRVDGFWFAAFLRARGGDVLDPATGALGIDEPIAATTLAEFGAMFGPGGPAPSLPPAGGEERDEIRQFRNGTVKIALTGPWAAHDLGNGTTDGLLVAPFPRSASGRPAAPRGGQLFAVPACAGDARAGWALARDLTAPRLQADWGHRFGIIPTTRDGLDRAGELSQSFYRAVQAGRPLPRHPLTPEMFDDLTPAIAAVVAGDATPQEALAGVARAWTRLLSRHGIAARRPPSP